MRRVRARGQGQIDQIVIVVNPDMQDGLQFHPVRLGVVGEDFLPGFERANGLLTLLRRDLRAGREATLIEDVILRQSVIHPFVVEQTAQQRSAATQRHHGGSRERGERWHRDIALEPSPDEAHWPGDREPRSVQANPGRGGHIALILEAGGIPQAHAILDTHAPTRREGRVVLVRRAGHRGRVDLEREGLGVPRLPL